MGVVVSVAVLTMGQANASASPSEPPPMFISQTPAGLIIASKDTEALDDFESLISLLAANDLSGNVESTVAYLKHVTAETAIQKIQVILDERTDDEKGTDVQADAPSDEVDRGGASEKPKRVELLMVPDARLNLLVLSGRSRDVTLVRELIAVMDQPASPVQIATIPKPCLVSLKHVSAGHVCEVVRAVFASYIDNAQSAMMPMPGVPFGGQPANPNGPQLSMTVAVDYHRNHLVVSAPDELLREVIQLAESIDANHEAVSIKTCTRLSPAVVEQALSLGLGSETPLPDSAVLTSSNY